MSFSCTSITINKDQSVIINIFLMNSFNNLLDQLTTPNVENSLRINFRIEYMIKSINFLIQRGLNLKLFLIQIRDASSYIFRNMRLWSKFNEYLIDLV